MKVQVYSQWMEEVCVPARVKQFTRAAKLCGFSNFADYAQHSGMAGLTERGAAFERQAVAAWLDSHTVHAMTEKVA